MSTRLRAEQLPHELSPVSVGWTRRYPELKPIVETAWSWHRAHPHGYADR